MSRLLDTSFAKEVGEELAELLSDQGYSVEESIPALVQAIIIIAGSVETARLREQLLDEAADLLADGGVNEV